MLHFDPIAYTLYLGRKLYILSFMLLYFVLYTLKSTRQHFILIWFLPHFIWQENLAFWPLQSNLWEKSFFYEKILNFGIGCSTIYILPNKKTLHFGPGASTLHNLLTRKILHFGSGVSTLYLARERCILARVLPQILSFRNYFCPVGGGVA